MKTEFLRHLFYWIKHTQHNVRRSRVFLVVINLNLTHQIPENSMTNRFMRPAIANKAR